MRFKAAGEREEGGWHGKLRRDGKGRRLRKSLRPQRE
jgi:hypothetical protein